LVLAESIRDTLGLIFGLLVEILVQGCTDFQ
jgi:hypothetical protein